MADLTTLDSVRTYLGITDPSETDADGQIGRLITSESARFIALSGNPILSATYTETYDGNGTRFLEPRMSWARYPTIAVSSVVIDGNAIPQIVNEGDSGYALVNDRIELVGYLFTSARVANWYSVFPSFPVSPGVGNVTITYTAGYATVPPEVDQAVVEMVALKFKGRNRIGLMTQSVGGETASYQANPWAEIQSVIDAYTRLGI